MCVSKCETYIAVATIKKHTGNESQAHHYAQHNNSNNNVVQHSHNNHDHLNHDDSGGTIHGEDAYYEEDEDYHHVNNNNDNDDDGGAVEEGNPDDDYTNNGNDDDYTATTHVNVYARDETAKHVVLVASRTYVRTSVVKLWISNVENRYALRILTVDAVLSSAPWVRLLSCAFSRCLLHARLAFISERAPHWRIGALVQNCFW